MTHNRIINMKWYDFFIDLTIATMVAGIIVLGIYLI